MPVLAEQDIFGFDIAVDDAALMQVGESQEYLYDIEARDVLTEPSVSLDKPKQLPPGAVLHDENKKLLSLKSKLHLNEKRMGSILHNIPLIHNNILLSVLNYNLLIDNLHRVELPVLLETT